MKRRKLSYYLSPNAKLWILVLTSLLTFTSCVYLFFRGARLPSALAESDRHFAWQWLVGGLLIGCAGLSGIRITDRSADDDR